MKLGVEVGLVPGHIVLHGNPAPPPQNGHNPQFSAHVCCGQTAGWIKMLLGREVDVGPGDTVLDGAKRLDESRCHLEYRNRPRSASVDIVDGDPAPLKTGTAPPLFGSCLLWPNGWTVQDATWYGGNLGQSHIVLHGGAASLIDLYIHTKFQFLWTDTYVRTYGQAYRRTYTDVYLYVRTYTY